MHRRQHDLERQRVSRMMPGLCFGHTGIVMSLLRGGRTEGEQCVWVGHVYLGCLRSWGWDGISTGNSGTVVEDANA